jgi:hypothetical protein
VFEEPVNGRIYNPQKEYGNEYSIEKTEDN